MKKGWTTTKLIAAGSLAAMNLVLAILGAIITSFLGTPLIGGFINMAVLIITLLVINSFGAAAIYMTILGILILPLPIQGIPGFAPKVILLGLGGLSADILYFFFKKNRLIASVLVAGIEVPLTWFLLFKAARWFGIEGMEQFAKVLSTPIGVGGAFAAGGVGGLLGYGIYYKIKDSHVVKRIQGV